MAFAPRCPSATASSATSVGSSAFSADRLGENYLRPPVDASGQARVDQVFAAIGTAVAVGGLSLQWTDRPSGMMRLSMNEIHAADCAGVSRLMEVPIAAPCVLLRAGWMNKKAANAGARRRGRRQWKKRWFELTSDGKLCYYDKEKMAEDEVASGLKGVIQLGFHCAVAQNEGTSASNRENVILVKRADSKLYALQTASRREFSEWLVLLQSYADPRLSLRLSRDLAEGRGAPESLGKADGECVAALLVNTGRDLDYSHRGLTPAGGIAIGDAMVDATACVRFNVGYNPIGPPGAASIGGGMEPNRSIQSLILRHCDLGTDGARALAAGLIANRGLKALDVSGNDMGSAGAAAMAGVVQHHITLLALFVDDNGIGDAGAEAIARALPLSMTLKTLSVANNDIAARGTQALANGLCENSALRDIGMLGNPLGDRGARALASCLDKNSSLRVIGLIDCAIGDVGAAALLESLKQNGRRGISRRALIVGLTVVAGTSVTSMELSDNAISDTLRSDIHIVLRDNFKGVENRNSAMY